MTPTLKSVSSGEKTDAAGEAPKVVALHELVLQSVVLERHPWLTTKKLAQYRRLGRVRFLVGKGQEFVYPLSDLEREVNKDLECRAKRPRSSMEDNGSTESTGARDGIDSGTTGADDALVSRALAPLILNEPRRRSSRR